MTNPIDYFDGSEVEPTGKTLEDLLKLADESVELAKTISEEELETERKRIRMNEINRNRIPEIMQSLNMKSFKLQDGSELVVEDKLNASIPVAKKALAYAWLDEHGFGSLIKTELTSSFDRADREAAEEARRSMEALGIEVSVNESIHAGTLKAWVKEQMAAAGEVVARVEGDGFNDSEKAAQIPLDLFSVFEFKEAKIKAPKAKKKSSK